MKPKIAFQVTVVKQENDWGFHQEGGFYAGTFFGGGDRGYYISHLGVEYPTEKEAREGCMKLRDFYEDLGYEADLFVGIYARCKRMPKDI